MPRKQAFSSAKKKQQLLEKRKKKKERGDRFDWSNEEEPEKKIGEVSTTTTTITTGASQTENTSKNNLTKDEQEFDEDSSQNDGEDMAIQKLSVVTSEYGLRTVFEKEPREVVEKRIAQSREPFRRLKNKEAEKDVSLFDEQHKTLDIPIRPPWDYSMDRLELEQNEKSYFNKYIRNIYKTYSRDRLNHFEHNIEVWKQLWRVLEMSDVLFLISDIRHPLFHFPTSLYDYVTKTLKKPLIFVLNKADLVSKQIQNEWTDWFKKNFPLLTVVTFSSYTLEKENADVKKKKKDSSLTINRKKRKKFVDITLVQQLWDACKGLKDLVKRFPKINAYFDEVIKISQQQNEDLMKKSKKKTTKNYLNEDDINSNEDDINNNEDDINEDEDETNNEDEDGEEGSNDDDIIDKEGKINKQDLEISENSKCKEIVRIGFIGHPNVGKSSILNGLVGKTVVSTSYTPGHTKHFQTYPLSSHVTLCDCPGLVFPAVDMPRQLQVLCGLFPISQLREPYSSIQYLAERIQVEKYYKLSLPEYYEEWSAWAICEAFAEKRGYYTTKQSRPDVYRAANEILRDVLYGRLLLVFSPPSESQHKSFQLIENNPTGHSDNPTLQIHSQKSSMSPSPPSSPSSLSRYQPSTNNPHQPYQANISNPFDLLSDEAE